MFARCLIAILCMVFLCSVASACPCANQAMAIVQAPPQYTYVQAPAPQIQYVPVQAQAMYAAPPVTTFSAPVYNTQAFAQAPAIPVSCGNGAASASAGGGGRFRSRSSARSGGFRSRSRARSRGMGGGAASASAGGGGAAASAGGY